MERLRRAWARGVFAPLIVVACVGTSGGSGDPSDPGGGDPADPTTGSLSVSGSVKDLETDLPVQGSATIITDGLVPAPQVTVTGADYLIEGVLPHSVFNLLASAPPTHRGTYNAAVEVLEDDLAGVDVTVVSETFLQLLALVFEESDAGGIILARAVDASGAPYEGLPATAIEPPTGARGPYFLDDRRQPDPTLTETSASGYIVFFGVAPGVVGVRAAADANYTLTMADSPVASTTVTLGDILVGEGAAPPLPTNVSFSMQVAPIFQMRGCTSCHDGGGIGKDLGDLHLNGAMHPMYDEVAVELSPRFGVTRARPDAPEMSLLLTMPSREGAPDSHPTVVFSSATDPDFLMILAWITEGAREN